MLNTDTNLRRRRTGMLNTDTNLCMRRTGMLNTDTNLRRRRTGMLNTDTNLRRRGMGMLNTVLSQQMCRCRQKAVDGSMARTPRAYLVFSFHTSMQHTVHYIPLSHVSSS